MLPLAGTLLAFLVAAPAEPYHFFDDGRTDARIVAAEHAVRWSELVWAPGETLVFEVAPDPDFEVLFGSVEGVIPYLERALAMWADIGTADIELRVGGVVDVDRNPYRPKVFLNPETERAGGYAAGWDRIYSGKWERFSCDIGLGREFTVIPPDVAPEDVDDFRERQLEWAEYVLVHEMGHCLGLLHAGALSSTGRWDASGRLVHPGDPAMSYGYIGIPDGLSADDFVGASLLRPAPGFAATTGSITGTLDLDGEPAPYVQVWALPAGGDSLWDRIGAFSDHEGVFRIEGLEPGDYAVWALPIHRYDAQSHLIREDPPLDLDDTVLGRPVRVRAGSDTGDVRVSLRRGQTVRPRPDGVTAGQNSGPAIPITGRWGSPCAGVRIRAEASPSLADGHRAERDRSVGNARWYGTTLTLEWSSESAGVAFDWAGPYRNWYWDRETEDWKFFSIVGRPASGPDLDVNISGWQIQSSGSGSAVHTAEIAWPDSTEVLLRFRSDDASCDGEPLVVCTVAGCGMSSGPSAAP